MLSKPAFLIDTRLCTGCKTCMIACMDKHDLEEGVLWRRVVEYTGGDWTATPDGYRNNVFAYYISVACNHCENPICVTVCPTTAMNKDANGIVSVDPDKCVGCRYCSWACPYSAPQYSKKLGRVTKCDFCKDELQQDRPPACVAACPTRALHFGELEELRARCGNETAIAPLPDPSVTKPALFVIPHRNARPIGSKLGGKANPEEV
jgi:anaerobic dimethyl sulfoxide reductase subunit B